MSKTYDRMDAAIDLAADQMWWTNVASEPVLSDLLERAAVAEIGGDARGQLLRTRLDELSKVFFGVPAEQVGPGRARPVDELGDNPCVSSFASATIAGIQAAEERMHDFGLRSSEVLVPSDFVVTEDTRRQLGAEGAAATLRVLDGIRELQGADEEKLLCMVWDLNAHPWDRGPLRDQARYQLEGTIDGQAEGIDSLDREDLQTMIEEVAHEESHGVSAVAGIVSRANDRETLQARVARQGAVTARETSAASFPVSAAASLRSAHGVTSPAPAHRSGPAAPSASMSIE